MSSRDESLGLVYAEALLQLAFEKGVHAEVLAELRGLVGLLDAQPGFEDFLHTPRIRREVKKDLIDRVFGGNVSDVTLNFLRVVLDKRREGSLRRMVTAFEEGYHLRMGELVVKVQAATALDGKQRDRLVGLLKRKYQKEIVLEERVDPALLGGLVLRVGDRRIDGSLRSRLQAIGGRLEATRLRSEGFYEDQG